jgi:hypothetical protein
VAVAERPVPVTWAFGGGGEAMGRKLFRALRVLLLLVAAATAVKAAFFNPVIRKPGDPPPCWSRDEARGKGVWVCDVTVQPSAFPSGGRTYRLGEAWIEEGFEEDYAYVWFPRRTRLGWNRLCLRVPRYEDGSIELDRFGTMYAGPDFQYVKKLEAGEYPRVECRVQLWRTGSDQKIDLGKVILTPVPDRK